jgi:hypothetical protein
MHKISTFYPRLVTICQAKIAALGLGILLTVATLPQHFWAQAILAPHSFCGEQPNTTEPWIGFFVATAAAQEPKPCALQGVRLRIWAQRLALGALRKRQTGWATTSCGMPTL